MSIFNVNPVTVDDYRRLAERRLPRFLFDYLDGGANAEASLAANVNDFDNYRLVQRVLRNVDGIDTSTTIAGFDAAMPVTLAPVGMAGMYRRRGETQGARAADAVGVPYTVSTLGICPVEEIIAATGKPIWFQLYMLRDRDVVQSLLARAQAAGCTTLVFTVDLPVAGMRLRDYRNGMIGTNLASKLSKAAQLATSPCWAYDVGIKGKPHTIGNLDKVVPDPDDLNAVKAFIDSQFDPRCTWEDIAWLRSIWSGKIIIKGLMEVDDAKAAVDVGADGIVVSNHGARQLDSVASSISKLPAIAKAVGKQTEILVDGGIRSGIDVVKAVALGANGVMIGRPWVYANAARGEQGVTDLLTTFQKEIATAMALMGVTSIDQITSDLIEA
ncbi:L-lactate dehydrogenase [Marinobacterium nitratireducens]|uniref:L-lactate dehydrogenase n=1 Tax=Marinobacterium nitratireducens TaxID=518897 RepID=A0A918DR78_9GAMM|nr:L-lactate dehydrogenase [Marinobacterium nitratireducens]GGO78992.1 L-lactate dehydrogenase [Marinobacterium nitratireducens]